VTLIVEVVREERKRCADLVAKLVRGQGKEFAMWCIDNAVTPDETDDFKARYEQSRDDTADDLM